MRTRLQDWCEQVTPDDTPFFAGGYYRDLNQTQRKKQYWKVKFKSLQAHR